MQHLLSESHCSSESIILFPQFEGLVVDVVELVVVDVDVDDVSEVVEVSEVAEVVDVGSEVLELDTTPVVADVILVDEVEADDIAAGVDALVDAASDVVEVARIEVDNESAAVLEVDAAILEVKADVVNKVEELAAAS